MVGSLPKYLDDPFKKVSYSFRVEERLLEDIKRYANATNRKLPETFNHLLKKSLEGLNTNNTYLNDYEGVIINITFMEFQLNRTYGVDNIITDEFYTFTRGATDYTNFNFDGLLYEVDKIPNNLDKWFNDRGYYSNNGFIHEGVCLLIVPELILHDKTCITQESITNCLKFIYFAIGQDNTLKVQNISYKDCYRRLKEVGNDTDLIKFKNVDKKIYKFSIEFMKEYEEDPTAPDKIGTYKLIIFNELKKFAKRFNDGNIKSVEDKTSIISEDGETIEEDTESTSTDYKKEIEDLKKKVEDKETIITVQDGIIKDYEEKLKIAGEEVDKLQNTFDDINRRLEELESKRK